MSFNFSSSTNDTLPQFHSFSPAFLFLLCTEMVTAEYIRLVFKCTYVILVLPLSAVTLYLGLQQWKHHPSSMTAMSHSDFFTYNMAIVELIGVSGAVLGIIRNRMELPWMNLAEQHISGFPWTAQMLLPLLTCVERYLAVVWPITYMKVTQRGRVRLRNISTGLIWLLCCAGSGTLMWSATYPEFSIFSACLMMFCFITATFCCLSILCVLIRPRPGKVDQGVAQVDQSKQKAFKTIAIILGVLSFRFGGKLVCHLLYSLFKMNLGGYAVQCVAIASALWFGLPSSLVLPLLFLHRAGKIPGCKQNTKSG